MRFRIRAALPLLLAAAMAAPAQADAQAEELDAPECKDHPLFTRMPGYAIGSCESKEFDARAFASASGLDADNNAAKVENIEGAQAMIVYNVMPERRKASGLQIQRNFQNAARAGGGTVVAEFGSEASGKQLNDPIWGQSDYATVLRFTKGGKDVWAQIHPYNGGDNYVIFIGEREAMKQAVVANELLDAINRDGYVALYINFDTAKASIKPDSVAIVEQVAQMLKASPQLKLEVSGHTDNVGAAASNLALSQARAQSVMQALVARGIAASRLIAKGYGDTRAVADNRSEEGRAKNRRVELIKR